MMTSELASLDSDFWRAYLRRTIYPNAREAAKAAYELQMVAAGRYPAWDALDQVTQLEWVNFVRRFGIK